MTAPEIAEAALQYIDMAKKRSNKKTVAQKLAVAGRGLARKARRAAVSVAGIILDAKAQAAARMLHDPCNAPLSEACYRGDQGYKSRFVSNFTVGTGAGQTAAAVAFLPGRNEYLFVTTPTSASAGTWTLSQGPGNVFLQANAAGWRSLGACLSTTPVAANLATSGQVYTTIVTLGQLPSGGSSGGAVTVDQCLQLCNKYGKVQIDEPMETKWIPAAADEEYTVAGLADTTDVNVVLMCFVGLPAATGIVCRFTNVIEWKPNPTIGVVSESFMGNPSRNTIEHVKAALKNKDPNWWSNVGKAAYSVLRGYATGGVVGAAGAAMRAVKFM